MRIVFMGTPDFAVPTLQALLASEHDVTAVITQPDKPKGRGKELQSPPVKLAALKAGIPVFQPAKVRDEEFIKSMLSFISLDLLSEEIRHNGMDGIIRMLDEHLR